MSDEKVFIDTNIWIYSLVQSDDASEQEKRIRSLSLLETLYPRKEIVISTQILNECHWNLIRKFDFTDEKAYQRIRDNIMAIASVLQVSKNIYHGSYELRKTHRFSFWDSLVIASAIEGHCLELYTEDMQHGKKVDKLTIINPFHNQSDDLSRLDDE